jgi:hypothetical protein
MITKQSILDDCEIQPDQPFESLQPQQLADLAIWANIMRFQSPHSIDPDRLEKFFNLLKG